VFESYLALATGVATAHRDLGCFDMWQVSLERSLRRRALAEQHRKAAPKTKGAAAAVSAALLVSPLLPMASASAQGGGAARSSLVTPLKRAFDGHVLKRGAKGATVAQIQRLLGVAADGICGGVLVSPVHGTKTAGFGDGRHHQGVDLAAPVGTPVKAAACGTVSFAAMQSGYGNMVCVQHSTTFSTCYAHLKDLIVAVGTPVAAGAVIGHVGMTGHTSGPHVHFETRVDGVAHNPAPYLARTKTIPGTAAPAAPAPSAPAAPAATPSGGAQAAVASR